MKVILPDGKALELEGERATVADVAKKIGERLAKAALGGKIDGKVVDGNRNLLFGLGATVDLEVFDIQRGRDHGVGRYNKLRDGLGFDEYASFEDFAADNGVDAATLAALKDVYDDDIEVVGRDPIDPVCAERLDAGEDVPPPFRSRAPDVQLAEVSVSERLAVRAQ